MCCMWFVADLVVPGLSHSNARRPGTRNMQRTTVIVEVLILLRGECYLLWYDRSRAVFVPLMRRHDSTEHPPFPFGFAQTPLRAMLTSTYMIARARPGSIRHQAREHGSEYIRYHWTRMRLNHLLT